MLLALLSGLIIVLGGALGGKTGIVIAFGLALIMNVGSYWYSDKIVLRMYQARELSESEAPMIYSMVRELAANAQIPMPRIAVVPEEAPNAFATGRNPENSVVAVTEGILRLLSPEELKGVLAHEIAHIANRDILIQTVAGVMASTIVSIANFMQFAAIFGMGRSSEDGEGGGSSGGDDDGGDDVVPPSETESVVPNADDGAGEGGEGDGGGGLERHGAMAAVLAAAGI